MKKLCSLLSFITVLSIFCSCNAIPANENIPHPLDYHEIMSLKTIEPGAVDLIYSDIREYFESRAQNDSPFACVEAECLNVTYYLQWRPTKNGGVLSGYSQYELKITKVGTAFEFPFRNGDVITVKSRVQVAPDFSDEDDFDLKKKEFVKNILGGVENPDTGEVILEGGIHEFVPMSDMQLALYIPDYDNVPMGVGEIYTTALLKDSTTGEWMCTHSYPASEDSIVFSNNFYNMTFYFKHNMHIVAYLTEKKSDFTQLSADAPR